MKASDAKYKLKKVNSNIREQLIWRIYQVPDSGVYFDILGQVGNQIQHQAWWEIGGKVYEYFFYKFKRYSNQAESSVRKGLE